MLVLVAGRDPTEYPSDGHLAYVRAHARAAIVAGYEPHILCVGASPRIRETDFGVVRRVASPFRPIRPMMISGHGPLLARGLVELAAELPGPVLVHGFGVWGWAGVRACARLRASGGIAVPLVSSYATHYDEAKSQVRGLAPGAGRRLELSFRAQALLSRAVIARYERVAYRRAAAVFVNYDSVRRLIVAAHGPEVRVRFLPYGPESDFLATGQPAGRIVPPGVSELVPTEAPLVVCIAFQRPRKGVDVLIDALAIARDRGTPLRACLVGDGPLLDAHRRRVVESGLTGSVAVLGPVPDAEAYLRSADIFVLPSRAEQSGSLALLEALRAGVASVASRVDGIPEDVVDGDSALLVEPGSAPELASALTRLATDPALRRRLGEGGRRRFAERFAAAPFSEALGAAYAELGPTAADRPRPLTCSH